MQQQQQQQQGNNGSHSPQSTDTGGPGGFWPLVKELQLAVSLSQK
jgi:hypothetical protein